MNYTKLKSLFSGIVLGLIVVTSNFAMAQDSSGTPCNETYTVKKGDTLTGILAEKIQSLHSDKHIYGSDGLLRATIRLNTDNIKSPDLIFPNQKILLPEEISSNCQKPQETSSEAPAEQKPEINAPKLDNNTNATQSNGTEVTTPASTAKPSEATESLQAPNNMPPNAEEANKAPQPPKNEMPAADQSPEPSNEGSAPPTM